MGVADEPIVIQLVSICIAGDMNMNPVSLLSPRERMPSWPMAERPCARVTCYAASGFIKARLERAAAPPPGR